MPVLVLGRTVQGFGAGVVPAVGYVAIGRFYPVESRPRMFAVLSTAWVVPGILGPALSERVAAWTSWRWIFLGLLPLVLAAGAVIVPAMMRMGAAVAERSEPTGPWMRRPMVEAVRVAAGAALDRRRAHPRRVGAGAVDRRRSARRSVAAAPAHTAGHAGRRAGLPATVLSRGW